MAPDQPVSQRKIPPTRYQNPALEEPVTDEGGQSQVMTPLYNAHSLGWKVVPPFLDLETGLFQACLPDLGWITMLVAGDAVEEEAVRVRQFAQPQLVKCPTDRQAGEKLMVWHTEDEWSRWLEHSRQFQQDRIDVRDVLQDRITHSTGEVAVREWHLLTIAQNQQAIALVTNRLPQRSCPGVDAYI